MSNFTKWATFFVLAFILIFTVVSNSLQSYRYNDITQYMEESAQAAINQSIDKSTRVTENKVFYSEELFEEKFSQKFSELSGSFNVNSLNYDYLVDSDGHYKAIRIQVIDDQDTAYQITYIIDFINT